MAITDLVPWKKTNNNPAVARGELDPFARMRQGMDEMFNDMLGSWIGRPNLNGAGSFLPQIDVTDTANEICVTAELPGLEQKDLEVSIVDGSLRLKGEKREEHEEERGDLYRSERRYGAFERMIPLPVEVEADQIKASYRNGVLKVILPKSKDAQLSRRVIPVES
jgi:HSP20 family protein